MEQKHKTLGKATDRVKEGFRFSDSSFNVRYDLFCSHEAVYSDNFCAFHLGNKAGGVSVPLLSTPFPFDYVHFQIRHASIS